MELKGLAPTVCLRANPERTLIQVSDSPCFRVQYVEGLGTRLPAEDCSARPFMQTLKPTGRLPMMIHFASQSERPTIRAMSQRRPEYA